MTYEIYDRPAQVQADDIEIVNTALTLARVLRDDVLVKGATAWGYTPFVEGIAKTIRDASKRINHPEAGHEVWRFGAYLVGTDRDDLDNLICDYLSSAQKIVEQGYGQ